MERTRGWIEAAARLTRVLLRSPRVKGALRIALRHLDPHHADTLVDALCETDPEVPFALVGALPELANLGIGVLRALVRQLGRLPAPLVAEVTSDLLSRVDRRGLLEALDGLLGVLDALLADPGRARSLAELSAELGRTVARHPGALAGLAALRSAFAAEVSR